MTNKNETVMALLGQPNSGKSTLFNALTGMRQHVGNLGYFSPLLSNSTACGIFSSGIEE